MTNEEMTLRIWKYIVGGVVTSVVVIAATHIVLTFHNDATSLSIRVLDATEGVRQTAQARAAEAQARSMEARALADKAMFESSGRK